MQLQTNECNVTIIFPDHGLLIANTLEPVLGWNAECVNLFARHFVDLTLGETTI